MFLETTASFMADFGSPVIYGGQGNTQSTTAIFDEPDAGVLSGRATSTGYRIEYPAADLIGLTHGDTVLVGIGPGWALDPAGQRLVYSGPDPAGGTSSVFRVLGTPNRIDDGTFFEARLEAI
jgi:hypothetical protein